MDEPDELADKVETLLATPDLAGALESEQFRRFLDQVPIAIAVSDMAGRERIVYANPEFERLSGRSAAELVDQSWSIFDATGKMDGNPCILGTEITGGGDFIGTYAITRPDQAAAVVDAYSNIIQDEAGKPAYRLAALVDVTSHKYEDHEDLTQKLREKDTLLMEVQHRVKNNLQMITALMRIEARNARGRMDTGPFERLAGRIEAIQILYGLLSDQGVEDVIDLGVFLSRVASSVLQAHAAEGIRLDLKVDVYPVSVNVAMPTGLVVNELLTNALKHAFAGRPSGTITLHSLTDESGCRITIADDGIGLPEGATWPQRGKLGAAIVQSLRGERQGASRYRVYSRKRRSRHHRLQAQGCRVRSPDAGPLAGRIAIVTGGGRGLGRAMSIGLARAGATVIATVAREAGELAALEGEAGAGRIIPVQADVTRTDDCERVVAAAIGVAGRLDILVNNAGRGMKYVSERFLTEPTQFWETDPTVWRMVIDTNVNGPFLMARAAVPAMRAAGWGRIVNISMNRETMRRAGFSPYGPSKAALESETVIWAQDLAGSGVTVNALLPGGATLTGMVPADVDPGLKAKLLDPAVMVPPLLWLASEASDGVTGMRFNAALWRAEADQAEAALAAGERL